jgi:hypothetical protein
VELTAVKTLKSNDIPTPSTMRGWRNSPQYVCNNDFIILLNVTQNQNRIHAGQYLDCCSIQEEFKKKKLFLCQAVFAFFNGNLKLQVL